MAFSILSFAILFSYCHYWWRYFIAIIAIFSDIITLPPAIFHYYFTYFRARYAIFFQLLFIDTLFHFRHYIFADISPAFHDFASIDYC
jgi:hypothetical protein